mmetsp:Transcript_18801/g.30715  ORF Transcript_18801/g.30715 Transcript_18801/m.30715 type:complete len:351 (+) Transcript_18801:233-1285(+)
MGNNIQHVGLKLDKAHRASCIGASEMDGSTHLEGGKELKGNSRISKKITTFKAFQRDTLQAAALSAVACDVLGFRLEFEVIGKPSLLWTLPRMTYCKVTQIFAHASAPPKITSVRGFYALYFLLKDLWESESFSQVLQEASAAVVENHGEEKKMLEEKPTEDDERPKEDGHDEECPICMDRDIQVIPSCGHGLCSNCYHGWKEKDTACPTCRAESGMEELWILPTQSDIPDSSEHVDDLMQAVHTYIQALPRLETRWEKEQRIEKEKVLRRRSQHSEEQRLRRSQSAHTTRERVPVSARSASARFSSDDSLGSDSASSLDYGTVFRSIMPSSFVEEQQQLEVALAMSVQI